MRTRTRTSWPPAIVAMAAALVAAFANPAAAQLHPWTTVGSAGVVDEADTAIVEFLLGEARVPAAAPANSVLNLRYNIVSLEGFAGPGQYVMVVRFRDNGAAARVRLDLRQYNATGTNSLLASFDSNDYAAAVGYQTRSECILVDWDFDQGPFFIEAALTKSAVGGQPALGIIQLIPGNCVP